MELTFGEKGAGFASEGGTGTEDDPYVYAFDSTAGSTLFSDWSTAYGDKLTAYDAEGNDITAEMASYTPTDGLTIRFALADGYAWPDGTRDDRWYTFVSVNALVAKPTSETVISSGTMTADENDGYLLTGTTVSGSEATIAAFSETAYTAALYDAETLEKVGTYTSGSTYQFGGTNAGAGTYYLVFTLNEGNAWSDGDTESYVYFTLVIGGNVKRITSTDVISSSTMTADETGCILTCSVAESGS